MTALAWMESAHCAHPLWRDCDIPTQRAMCAGCPVSAQCLSRAHETIRALTLRLLCQLCNVRKGAKWEARNDG